MGILFFYLIMILLWSSGSYLYASDQSKLVLLTATQQELDDIDRDAINKMSHADTAITTLQSVLTKDAVSLVIDFLRPTETDDLRYRKLTKDLIASDACRKEAIGLFSITEIMTSLQAKDTIDIATTFIQKNDCGVYSMHQGKIRYNHATDTFSPISLFTPSCSNTRATCLCCNNLPATQVWEKLSNLDNQKSLSTAVLPDGATVTALSSSQTRFICVDNNNARLADAYTRWLSNAAYTQWLSRIHNKSSVKALKWDGQQS